MHCLFARMREEGWLHAYVFADASMSNLTLKKYSGESGKDGRAFPHGLRGAHTYRTPAATVVEPFVLVSVGFS